MKELKGSKTEKNLMAAFAGESQARVKYGYFASAARKEGFEQFARIFEETSNQEKEHAKIWAKYLGLIGDTKANLQAAIDGEMFEYTDMYVEFARVAKEEGFDEIAARFEGVGRIEKEHEGQYKKALASLTAKKVFEKEKETVWRCLNCGHDHKGKLAPKMCPVCTHPQSYFVSIGCGCGPDCNC